MDPVGDADLCGELLQTDSFGIGVEFRLVRAADDDQFGICDIRIARIIVSKPLRGTNLPTDTIRWAFPVGAVGPHGVNSSTSTPHGTTEILERARPIRDEF